MQNYLPKEIRQENRKKENDFQEEITKQNKEWVKERRLEFLSKELKENECQILAINNTINKNCPKWLQEFVFESEMKTFLRKNRKMNYEMKVWKAKEYVDINRITDDNVDEAKSVLISEILNIECSSSSCGREKYLCPFSTHNEKTPSFVVYLNSNTFHCFGCQKNGDSISLVKELYKMDFISAVKFLIHK